ncbi:MAG: hypothetical protein H6943_10895 [Zoogloeaceae bacterium]|nr:hypothetical protein [Zoogloeaceae bacterium]
MMSGKDEYVRKMHSKLDQWNHEIEGLVARKDAMAESARAEVSRHLDELRQKRDEAQAHLKTLQESSGSAWEDMKAGLDLAWESIAQAVESARSRFK